MTLSKKEQDILNSIFIPSENDPNQPEFPPELPRFPATPTYKINVPGFKNVWLKDESHNPTGTHKDRMAWEMVVFYKHFLKNKKEKDLKNPLPRLSIISSGSAALAVQKALQRYHLPNLKVLMDHEIKKEIIDSLESTGCEIYKTDLNLKAFGWNEILKLTENENGLDISSNQAFDPNNQFYDWLSYEIINNSPDYCFVPFGTGTLYENILNINKKELSSKQHDPRFQGSVDALRNCHFLGATTNDPHSKAAEKLYSHHAPFGHFDEQWIRTYRLSGFCGELSNVYVIQEQYLDEALALAEKQKIDCEPSGIAGLALLLQMQKQIPKDKKILVVNTGKAKMD